MARILIIDDDVQIRLMLRLTLEQEGHQVAEACDGAEGIARYRQMPVDLIISDLIMPGKEGIETIMELKTECAEVKIIAISGGGRNGPEQYLDLAQKLGADRTFVKPVERRYLLAAVNELLS